MSEYVTYPIQELLEQGILFIGDGYRAKNSELDSHGLPFARGANINNGFLFDDADRFPIESLSRVGNKVSQAGDVVFTSKGTVGRFAFVDENIEQFVYSPQLCFWRVLDTDWIEPRYLFYWMNGREFYLQYSGVKGQTDMADYVSLTDQRRMFITVPPLHEQRAIAHILGPLDDKIEANRRQNETLEATVRAIFKSWFVDFDPVHARSRGEQPSGMDAETAALFPDSFEESELGLIPCGWQVATIGDHVKATKGLSYKGEHLVDNIEDGIPMHNLNSINEWGTYKFDGIKFYSGEYQPRHEVKPGDLIVANTEQGFDLLLIASPAIVPAVFGSKGIISHHVYKVEVKRKSPLTRLFLYYRIMMSPFRDLLQGYTNGTTVNMLPADAFERPQFIMPPSELMQRFESIVAPMLEQIEHIYEESRTLVETRDALLPRLVSGELRVGEMEDMS